MNVAVIISGVDYRYIAFEWFVKYIDKGKFNLTFIAIDCRSETFNEFLVKNKVNVYRLTYGGKNKLHLLHTIWKVFRILKKELIQVVHTHVFDANLIGQIAAILAGIKKRIYTRHYSTATHYYGKSRVKWDRLINWLATDVIAISKVVESTLVEREAVAKEKIRLIHHGFDLEEFRNVDPLRKERIIQKYIPLNSGPIIGVISTFQRLKGIEYIIFGFKKLLKNYPHAYLMLANAKGKDENYYNNLLDKELPKHSFRTIKYEDDIAALFSIFEVFVHAPIDSCVEAFGQVYIEAMASEIPMVITKSGIACEVFHGRSNSFIADFRNSEDIYLGLKKILEDEDFRNKMIASNNQLVKQFEIHQMIQKLTNLYLKVS